MKIITASAETLNLGEIIILVFLFLFRSIGVFNTKNF